MDDEFLDEIWAQFESEALEHCKNSEDLLLDSVNKDLSKAEIDSIFRSFHSLKGLTGSIGLSETVTLTHLAEDLISESRKGKIILDDNLRTALLNFTDVLKAILQKSIKERKEVITKNFGSCKSVLEEILHGKPSKIKQKNRN